MKMPIDKGRVVDLRAVPAGGMPGGMSPQQEPPTDIFGAPLASPEETRRALAIELAVKSCGPMTTLQAENILLRRAQLIHSFITGISGSEAEAASD